MLQVHIENGITIVLKRNKWKKKNQTKPTTYHHQKTHPWLNEGYLENKGCLSGKTPLQQDQKSSEVPRLYKAIILQGCSLPAAGPSNDPFL